MAQTTKLLIWSVVAAISILAAALLAKGTTYENAWLYVFTAWIIILPAIELYLKKKQKGKNK